MTVDAVGKMLWLEGFSRPVEIAPGQHAYAVVTRENVEAVLTRLYEVDVPANFVLRYLRQVGLIKFAPAMMGANGGPMRFRYTCANPARDKNPTTIEDVDELIAIIGNVRKMLGLPPAEPDEDDDPAHLVIVDETDSDAERADNIHNNECPAHWNEDAPCNEG